MKTRNILKGISGAVCLGLLTNPMLAQAQSSVEIYGLVGVYMGSTERSGVTARTTQVGQGGLTTSYIGFRGTEDLGNGLKAVFQLENFFQPDTGASGRSSTDPTAFSRNAWVGLSGDFGKLTVGRHTNQYYLAMAEVNPFQGSTAFSPLVLQSFVANYGATVQGDTYWDNTVQYSSPAISGFTASVQHSFGEVAGANSIDNNGLHIRYEQGPFAATLAAQRVKLVSDAASAAQNSVLAGASYDLGFVKLFASAQTTQRNVTEVQSKTYQLGGAVPVTVMSSVLMSWANTTIYQPKKSDTTRNTAALGYDYFLSKRTDVYCTYLYDKLTANSVGNSYVVGIRHTF